MKTRHFLMMATLAVGMAMTGMIMTSCAKEDNPIHQPSDTWDAAKRTFTWQGTPSATVEMLASEEIDLENVQIQFTID